MPLRHPFAMPQFAANLSFLYTEHPFLERFAAAAEDGFTAVEYLFPYDWPAHQLQQLLRTHGLRQVLFNAPAGGGNRQQVAQAWQQGLRGTTALEGQEAAFRYGVALALEYAQALDCGQIHLMSGLLDAVQAREASTTTRWLHRLTWAAEQAAAVGCRVLIEPINHHDMPGYYLHTQQQAHAALQTIGHPQLGLQLDLYHCQRTEGDALAALQQALPTGRVGHIQIAGVPGRHEPDCGSLPWQALFQQLDDAQWPGWVGCEYQPATHTRAGLGWLRAWQERVV